MAVKKLKKVRTKNPAKKTSKGTPKKTKQKTAKKKIKLPAKKKSKAPARKTLSKPKKKTAKKKTPSRQTRAQKVSRKIKKKPVRKVKTAKRPSISRKRTTKKSKPEKNIALRRFLINRREDILREAKNEISKYIKGETRQLVESALDDGDWSVIDLSEDISLRQLSAHRGTLLKIDEALRKLDDSTYGICEDCGEAINERRLKIMPFAIYCVECQEKLEQIEKIEREEGLR
jgi:DnaK suppressor protein